MFNHVYFDEFSHSQRILGERLLISSLPGQGFENACQIARLAEQFDMGFEAEPGKLDIKRRKSGILFISLPIGSLFKLAIMT